MLSDSSIRAFDISIRLSMWIKSCPFFWNKESRRLEVDDSPSTRNLFSLSMGFILFHAVFVSIRTLGTVFMGNVDSTSFILQLTLMFQCFLALVMQMNTYMRRYEMADFISMILQIERHWTQSFQTKKAKDVGGPFLWSLLIFNIVQIFGVAFLFITHPKVEVFYFSMSTLGPGWRYLFSPLEVLPYAICWLNALPYSGTVIMFLTTESFWLNEMKFPHDDDEKERLTSNNFRTMDTVLLTYRSMQILTIQFSMFLNFSAMVGHKLINLLLAIGSLYGTIAFYNRLPITAYITFPTATICLFLFVQMIYPFAYDLNVRAEMFRSSWRLGSLQLLEQNPLNTQCDKFSSRRLVSKEMVTSEEREPNWGESRTLLVGSSYNKNTYLLKHLKSCRHLSVAMGSFYYFKQSTSVTFLYIVTDYAIDLLLSFND